MLFMDTASTLSNNWQSEDDDDLPDGALSTAHCRPEDHTTNVAARSKGVLRGEPLRSCVTHQSRSLSSPCIRCHPTGSAALAFH